MAVLGLPAVGTGVREGATGREERSAVQEAARARHDVKMAAISKAKEIFLAIDPRNAPPAPGHPPGLYCLQDCCGTLLPREIMGDLHAPVEALRNLQLEGQLAGRVSAAWGALQFNVELTVSCPNTVFML